MKKILFILFTALVIGGCSVSTEEMEKDKTFLKSQGLKYDRVLLNWKEPSSVRYLTSQKFIAVWQKSSDFGGGYSVRVLFDRMRVVGWKIDEVDMDKVLSAELSSSSK